MTAHIWWVKIVWAQIFFLLLLCSTFVPVFGQVQSFRQEEKSVSIGLQVTPDAVFPVGGNGEY
ncbi:MAG: hypothetical protein K9L66_04555 [Spirochaetaceae bacterium]|nr:hypothetical protein [Spirochaetaceae bacterium]MCF7948469.1 hypothetical protein [Spirochaetia bacterium]MCF7950923.1 hypothetical protein [Spirochaetaceae bacterium]